MQASEISEIMETVETIEGKIVYIDSYVNGQEKDHKTDKRKIIAEFFEVAADKSLRLIADLVYPSRKEGERQCFSILIESKQKEGEQDNADIDRLNRILIFQADWLSEGVNPCVLNRALLHDAANSEQRIILPSELCLNSVSLVLAEDWRLVMTEPLGRHFRWHVHASARLPSQTTTYTSEITLSFVEEDIDIFLLVQCRMR